MRARVWANRLGPAPRSGSRPVRGGPRRPMPAFHSIGITCNPASSTAGSSFRFSARRGTCPAISTATASTARHRGPCADAITRRARPPISADRTTLASAAKRLLRRRLVLVSKTGMGVSVHRGFESPLSVFVARDRERGGPPSGWLRWPLRRRLCLSPGFLAQVWSAKHQRTIRKTFRSLAGRASVAS